MSEGTFFHCYGQPNLKLYIGSYIIEFKNGRYPTGKRKAETDEGIIGAIKSHPDYGKKIESDEDRTARMTPDPKVEKRLQEMALERLKNIPGVVPSALTPSQPQEESPEPSPEPLSDSPVREPSLTEVSRMSKKPLLGLCDMYDIEVTPSDTVAIIRRKVKSWIKQNT